MELHQVRYYIALCKTLNFTRAAALCNVTQPALTRAIQRLEEELGGPLFQRERNLTQLTELGRLMQPLLEQSLASAEAAKAHAQRFGRRELGSLRLGVAPGIALGAATPALAQVAERIPTLVVEIAADPQPRIVEKLLAGELDAAFLADDGALPERLTCWRLYTEGYRVAMISEHALAAREAVPAADLAGQAIVLRRDCAATSRLCEQQGAAGTGFRLQHRVDSDEHLLQLVAASLGLAIVPERLALAPSLVTRPLDGIELKRTVLLAVVNGRRFSPALDAFIRLIRACDFSAAA